MSKTVTLVANASALISEESGYLNFNDHSSGQCLHTDARELIQLAKFPALSGEDRYREIQAGTAYVYCWTEKQLSTGSLFVRAQTSSFDVNTVNGANHSTYPGGSYYSHQITKIETAAYRPAAFDFYWEARSALITGISIDGIASNYDPTYSQTAYGANPPKLELILGDVLGVDITEQLPKANSSLNIKKACNFSFTAKTGAGALETIALTAAELQWRVSGSTALSSRVLNAEEMEAKAVTMPADGFSTGDIEYRFALTANSGAVTYGEWVALVTPEPEVYSYSPAAGTRLNRLERNVFHCLFRAIPEGNSYWLDGQSGGVLRWRVKGESAVNEAALVAPSYTAAYLPSGTLPSGSIEYQLSAIDELGRTVETPWVTISTVDTISTARAIAPAGSVEDGERPITMRWEHINESGTLPTQSEIQIAQPGEAFTVLATIYGNATEYAAPARTFASGEWRWRVRTYNIDSAAGAWSEEASFVVIASPATPVLVLEEDGPRPVVRWQTSEQEGYELELDGVSLGTRFGATQRWKSKDYVEDGQHNFRVRVQNVYGLWSEWGMLIFPVANEARAAIALTGSGSREAKLQWNAAGYDFYIIYRNGVPVGKTTGTEWTDLFAIDVVSYEVKGGYKDSGNYGRSNRLDLDVIPESLIIQMVSRVDTEGWISLRLSQTQHRVTKSSRGRTVKLLQLSGAAYPVAEPEEAQSLSIQISCAFKDRAEARVLEALTGELVCVKTPHGERAIGYLQNLNKNGEEFYSSYSFTVQHLEFEEAIDIDA